MADREFKVTVTFTGTAEVIVTLWDDDDDEDAVGPDAVEMVENGLTFADGDLSGIEADVSAVEERP